jgi:MFS family permease
MSNPQPVTLQPKNIQNLWRDADFLKLWVGQTISMFGSSLSRLAIPLIAALMLNATPAEMGFLAAVGTAPSLLIGLFAGIWVDKIKRRPLLILSDAGRALLLITIPAAAYLGILTMVHLYSISFLVGIFTVFFDITSRSYLPSLIDRTQLFDGNSKLELSGSITSIAGPSLAGLIIEAVTAPMAVIFDAVSYLLSALCILFIRRREQAPVNSSAPILPQVREGLHVLFANPLLRAFAGCLATSNFASNIFFALYILFGVRELGLNAAQLGLVYGLGASGALVGAIVAPRVAARIGIGRALTLGALIGSLEVMPVIFATPSSAAALLFLSSLLGNFGWVLYNVYAVSLRQAIVPSIMQGRVNATFSFLVAGMLPLGALAGGLLGTILGLRNAILIAAVGSLLSVLWIVFSPARGVAQMPAD